MNAGSGDIWREYDLLGGLRPGTAPATLPGKGTNRITVTVVARNERLAEEFPLQLEDVELVIRYAFPSGEWQGIG